MSNLWVIPEELGDYADSEYAYEACKVASYLMWGMSGRKFNNVNTVTEHYAPIRRFIDNTERYITSQVNSYYYSRGPLNANVPIEDMRLRGNPVQSITSITGLDGVALPNTEYSLLDKTWVHFHRPITTPVIVTYSFGVEPPTAGHMAARHLAIQFAKLWAGADDCELPDRVTSVTRQGVSFTVLDNQEFIQELRTGIYSVDLFLKTVNPDAARQRPKVFRAGSPRGVRVSHAQVGTGGWALVAP